jgi:hypothetical protein
MDTTTKLSNIMVSGAAILFTGGLIKIMPVFDEVDKNIKYYFNAGSALIIASSALDIVQTFKL